MIGRRIFSKSGELHLEHALEHGGLRREVQDWRGDGEGGIPPPPSKSVQNIQTKRLRSGPEE